MDLAKELEPFKASEIKNAAAAAVLIDDPLAFKVASVWGLFPVEWYPPQRRFPNGMSDQQKWNILWKGVRFDLMTYAKQLGLPSHIVENKLTMLAMARLVYPDGTLSTFAKTIIHTEVTTRAGMGTIKKKKGGAQR